MPGNPMLPGWFTGDTHPFCLVNPERDYFPSALPASGAQVDTVHVFGWFSCFLAASSTANF
jgi:hypothetical protein